MNNNQNNKILYGIGGLIIGILIASAFAPMMRYGYNGMMFRRNSDYNPKSSNVSPIDQHFIEQMIPHHEGAIAMANLALEKASHPEIKALAQAILKAQTSENQEMRSWYQDWFKKSVPANGNVVTGGMMSQGGMHMGSIQDINALENAPDFDKEFIEQMIPHHQMAIMMARMLEAGTNRPEMLQLAKNIQSSQTEEIQEMQTWYRQWYR